MSYVLSWTAIAFMVGVVAPIKAKHWTGWLIYLGVVAFLVYMTITVAEEL